MKFWLLILARTPEIFAAVETLGGPCFPVVVVHVFRVLNDIVVVISGL